MNSAVAVSGRAGPPQDSAGSVDDLDALKSFRRPPRIAVARWLRENPAALTWWGLALAASGCGLIALGWLMVAREGMVYRQLPYVVSAGLTGLALVLVGATVVNIAARQRDALDADEQIDALVSRLERLSGLVEDRSGKNGSRVGRLPSALPSAVAVASDRWAVVGEQDTSCRASRAFQGALALSGTILAAGFVSLGLAWYGVATTREVARQLPYIVSGGLFGFALVTVALAVLNAQFRTWTEASRRTHLAEALAVVDNAVEREKA